MAGDWSFPAPGRLKFSHVTEGGYRLAWDPVKGPGKEEPAGYTVRTIQLDGVQVDEFTTRGTSTSEYGRGGAGLHPGWTYRTEVWANGGPKAPPHATVTVTLRPEILPEPVTPLRPAQAAAAQPAPVGPATGATAAAATARAATTTMTTHPSVWQPWTALTALAEARMPTEITDALKAYEHDLADAGRILDVAYAEASEVSGRLEDTAWAAWNKTMAAAAEASDRVLGPALKAYDAAVSAASARYGMALGAAEAAYKQVAADVERAKRDAPAAAAG